MLEVFSSLNDSTILRLQLPLQPRALHSWRPFCLAFSPAPPSLRKDWFCLFAACWNACGFCWERPHAQPHSFPAQTRNRATASAGSAAAWPAQKRSGGSGADGCSSRLTAGCFPLSRTADGACVFWAPGGNCWSSQPRADVRPVGRSDVTHLHPTYTTGKITEPQNALGGKGPLEVI